MRLVMVQSLTAMLFVSARCLVQPSASLQLAFDY